MASTRSASAETGPWPSVEREQGLPSGVVQGRRPHLPPPPASKTPGPIDPCRVRDHHDPTSSSGCINPAVTRSCSSPNSRESNADGPFVLLETPDHRTVGYVEGQRGSYFLPDPEDVSALSHAYGTIQPQALDPESSVAFIERLAGDQ
jgi:hypothetical protein